MYTCVYVCVYIYIYIYTSWPDVSNVLANLDCTVTPAAPKMWLRTPSL